MRSATLALTLLTLTSCGGDPDPCSGTSGACVAILVQGSASLDTLTFTLAGALSDTWSAPTTVLPDDIAVPLASDKSGPLTVSVRASHGTTTTASGMSAVTLAAGAHTIVHITLGPPMVVTAGCSDGVKNGDETDIDCGGSCSACAIGKMCKLPGDCASALCTAGLCATSMSASFSDGKLDGDETDVDCGGSCPACADGKMCKVAMDCLHADCRAGMCLAPSCSDGLLNNGESDVDCGGANCGPCANGKMCKKPGDCTSAVCTAGLCVAATCSDKILDGKETDVDCGGGACPPCVARQTCVLPADCDSDVCTNTVCAAATCSDGVENQSESDVDCGGTCAACANGKMCKVPGDCQSAHCMGGLCVAASCSDGIKNNAETDVDCGGSCAPCANSKMCKVAGDCASANCVAGVCAVPTCSDGVKNQSETDVDCGGTCGKCANGKMCKVPGDCASISCGGGVCAAPTCSDGVKNGAETDVDCGGGACKKCGGGKACMAATDCLSNACVAAACGTVLAMAAPRTYAVGDLPQSAVVADLNGDGVPDILVAELAAGDVRSLIGVGDGTFNPGRVTTASNNNSSSPGALAVADVDGDKIPDAVLTALGSTISVLHGKGDGSFSSTAITTSVFTTGSLLLVDLDGDGKLDAVTRSSTAVVAMQGFNDGTFDTGGTFPKVAVPSPAGLLAADMNNDKSPDIIVVGFDGAVRVLLNDTHGTLTAQAAVTTTGVFLSNPVAGDFDGDNQLDVACTAGGSGMSGLLVFHGGGDGRLTAIGGLIPTGANLFGLARGDFDGDGHLDLATSDFITGQLRWFHGDGAGHFAARQTSYALPRLGALVAADLDGDGHLDLVTTSGCPSSAVCARGQVIAVPGGAGGPFMLAPSATVGWAPYALTTGDLDGDGHADLVTIGSSVAAADLLFGDGKGGFAQTQTAPPLASLVYALAAARFDTTSTVDQLAVIRESQGPEVVSIDATGAVSNVRAVTLGTSSNAIAVGDLDGKLGPDLVLNATGSNLLTVLLNDGTGRLTPTGSTFAASSDSSVTPASLVLADLDGDKHLDLIVGCQAASPSISVLAGKGDGGFLAAQVSVITAQPTQVAVGDLDGDGHLDVVASSALASGITTLRNTGTGGVLATPTFLASGDGYYGLVLADLDHDGKLDAAATDDGRWGITIFRGNGAGALAAVASFAAGPHPDALVSADFNGDGLPDLATTNIFQTAPGLSTLLNRSH